MPNPVLLPEPRSSCFACHNPVWNLEDLVTLQEIAVMANRDLRTVRGWLNDYYPLEFPKPIIAKSPHIRLWSKYEVRLFLRWREANAMR